MIPYTALNFVLIGDTYVGKTPFLDRYFKKIYREGNFFGTFGVDKEVKYVKIYDNIYKVTVLDTEGKERFKRFLPKKYYQNADGILLLFDLTNRDTFYNISFWIKYIKDNCSNERVPIIYLIGNKVDLPNIVISKKEAEELAKSFGMKYFEISCKFNINIYEIMARIIIESIFKKNKIDESFKKILNEIINPRLSELIFEKNILSKYLSY